MADYTWCDIPGSVFCIYSFMGAFPGISAGGRNQLWCKTIRPGKAHHESVCNHSNFISAYFLFADYVSTEYNSLYVYYNAVRSGTGSKRFPSVSTVIYFVGSLNCDSASDAVSWQSYASVLVIFRQIAIYNLRPIIMPYIAGFGVYSVFAISLIIDMTVFIVVDGMMLTEFRRMDVLKSIGR